MASQVGLTRYYTLLRGSGSTNLAGSLPAKMLECGPGGEEERIEVSVQYVERFYSRFSTFYDLVYGLKVFNSGRELVPELLDLFPGAQLLEVGVGTGLSIPLLPRSVEVTGIDFSQKMLHQARKRLESIAHRNVQLFKMDAARLEFPDNSFDRVLAAYFISTLPDPVPVIQEMKRVCRPGGMLVFVNHFQHEFPPVRAIEKHLSPLFYRLGFRTDLNLHELAEETDLKIDKIEHVDFLGALEGSEIREFRLRNPDRQG